MERIWGVWGRDRQRCREKALWEEEAALEEIPG